MLNVCNAQNAGLGNAMRKISFYISVTSEFSLVITRGRCLCAKREYADFVVKIVFCVNVMGHNCADKMKEQSEGQIIAAHGRTVTDRQNLE